VASVSAVRGLTAKKQPSISITEQPAVGLSDYRANSRLSDNSTALLLVCDPSCRSQLSQLLISLSDHVHIRNTLVIVSFHLVAAT